MFNKFHKALVDNYHTSIRKQIAHPKFSHANFDDAYHLEKNCLLEQVSKRGNSYVLLCSNKQFFYVSKETFDPTVIQQLIPKHLLTYYPELLL